uniref:DUF7027 domain-containing protein n=1 Tax=Plectus sambesii TaxID=2011161 RepID=A0A914W3M4_9BILA
MCCLHVKTWTWIIALVELIIAVIGFADIIGNLVDRQHRAEAAFWAQLAIEAIWVLFIVMLVVALSKNRAQLIIPHLFVSFAVVVFFVVDTIILIINVFTFWVFIYNGLLIIIVLSFIVVEYRCYLWMKEYHEIGIDN